MRSNFLCEHWFIQLYFRKVDVWIGLTDQKQEGKWEWVNPGGSCSKFTKWTRGEPNNQGNEDCVVLSMYTGEGEWNDRKCNQKVSFICEIGATVEHLCPDSTKLEFQGIKYQLVSNRKTWMEAASYCKGLKGHLATITSNQMNMELLAKMRLM